MGCKDKKKILINKDINRINHADYLIYGLSLSQDTVTASGPKA